MNQCEKYEELCSVYLDGELTAAEQTELEAHLAACPDCEAYLEALRQAQTMLSHGQEGMPRNLHENIMNLVMAEAQKTIVQTEKPRRHPPVFTMLAAAVAAVLLVMTGAVGELVSTGRDMLGLDNAKTADSAAAPKIAASQDNAGTEDAAASEFAPFSAPATGTAPEAAAAAPFTDDEGGTASAATGGAADGAADKATNSQTGTAGSAVGSAPAESAGQDETMEQQHAVQSRMMTASPQATLPKTPASLQEQSFAFCYVARGTGEAPGIEATYLDKSADGTASYYAIKNNMSVLEKALADLSKGGYEPEQYDSVSGVLFDGKAENGLIIVILSN